MSCLGSPARVPNHPRRCFVRPTFFKPVLAVTLLVALLAACSSATVPASPTAIATPSVATSASSGTPTLAPTVQPTSAPATSTSLPNTPAASARVSPTAFPGFPVTVTEDAGRTVTFDRPPRRIISLSPGHTETLYALGLGDEVVM